MIIAVDMDNTLTEHYDFRDYLEYSPKHWIEVYKKLKPKKKVIEYVNELSKVKGNHIFIFTARDDIYEEVTIQWLKKHNVNYEWVQMKKPFFDLLIDDRTMRPDEID